MPPTLPVSAPMQPRQTVLMAFSSFLSFEGDRPQGWLVDRRLQRHMQRCWQQLETPTDSGAPGQWPPRQPPTAHRDERGELNLNQEAFWITYWHRHWKETVSQLARGHLHAYLQEPCYWAAHSIHYKFASHCYGLPDFFQLAIAAVDGALTSFDPTRGTRLKGFAQIVVTNALRDMLRQQREADLCSTWTLLRKVSRKRVSEALEQAGVNPTQQGRYLLAWQCFKELYVPQPGQPSRDPDPQLWGAIAAAYQQLSASLEATSPGATSSPSASSPKSSSPDSITGDRVQAWMAQLTAWLRSYLYPKVGSLNTLIFDGEEEREIADPQSVSLLDRAIEQEAIARRQQQQQQLRQQLLHLIEQLKPDLQVVIQHYYELNQTQVQIAQALDKPQSWVSRRLSKARETLLDGLVVWAQQQAQAGAAVSYLHNAPGPDELKAYSLLLEDWLRSRLEPPGASS